MAVQETPDLKIVRHDEAPPPSGSKPVWTLAVLGVCMVGIAAAMYVSSRPPYDAVGWSSDFDEAASTAAASNKMILLDFTADWCPPCRVMDEVVFSAPMVGETIRAGFVPVRIDMTRSTGSSAELAAYFGVEGPPTFIALDSRGREITRQVGGLNQHQFLSWLADVQRRATATANSAGAP